MWFDFLFSSCKMSRRSRWSDHLWTYHCALCMILGFGEVLGAHWGNLGNHFVIAYQTLDYFFPAGRQRNTLTIFRKQAESIYMACLMLGWWDIVAELSWTLWHHFYGGMHTKTLILKKTLRHSVSFNIRNLATGMEVRSGCHSQTHWREELLVIEIKTQYNCGC